MVAWVAWRAALPASAVTRLCSGAIVSTSRQTYHHGDLPNTLKRIALELIDEKGVNEFTLRDAAQQAGVSHSAAYRHFADKAALLAAVAEDGFEKIHTQIADARDRVGDDPIARYVAIGVAYLSFAIANPAYFRLMYGPSSPDRSSFPRLRELDMSTYQIAIGV